MVNDYRQPVTLGIDAGSKTIGISATTVKHELIAAELKPRNDVTKLLKVRRDYRTTRRNRTTRYRKARFKNRTRTKPVGWTAPSVNVKIHNHIQGIKLMAKILPITRIVIEAQEFDLHALKNKELGLPVPDGIGYQHGEQYGHYNLRQYVLYRDGYQCKVCKTTKSKFHVCAINPQGGNSPDNMTTLCKECSQRYSKGLITLPKRKSRTLKDAAFMGIMRKTLVKLVRQLYPKIEVTDTYGYITKGIREDNAIPKSHINDAYCITGNLSAKRNDVRYLLKPVRSHNRQIHKATILKGGIRKLNQAVKYVKGFKLFDKVNYTDCETSVIQECFIFGRRTSGSFDIRKLDGTKINAGISYKKLTLLERATNILIERRMAVSSHV